MLKGQEQWTRESLLKAYGSLGLAVDSVDQAIAMARGNSSASSVGDSLPELLRMLDLDHDLFIAWQNVLSAPDVRAAVELVQQQASPSSMAPDGQPLWPAWLLKTVVDRAETVAEGHLAIAAIAHHLPYLSTGRNLFFTAEMIRIASRLDMVTALPILVDSALRLASQPHKERDRQSFLNQLLRSFCFSRAHRDTNQALVNVEVLRVLDRMVQCEPEVSLEQSAFDRVFQVPFLSTPELHDTLLLYAKRHGLDMGLRHMFTLLDRASIENDEATATLCIRAIETRQALVHLAGTAKTDDSSDRPPVHFTPGSVKYLRSLARHPEKALAYYQTLQRPQTGRQDAIIAKTTPSKTRPRWQQIEQTVTESESAAAERQCWAELVRIFIRWHKHMPVKDILEMIGSASTDAAPTSQASTVCAADAAMRSLLCLDRTDDAFYLWQKVFEDEGLPPSDNSLTQYIWASNNDLTPDRALGVVDNWAVRYGVHEIVPKSAAEDASMHFKTFLVRTARNAKPVPRVPLDAHLLERLLRALDEAGGRAATAFRVWRASEVRWGVRQSIGMLNQLLHSAAHANWVRDGKRTPGGAAIDDSDASDQARAAIAAAEEIDWVHAPTSAFLQSATAAEAEPWVEARRLFETIHLCNWPDLATVPHPFDEIHGPKLSPSLVVLSPSSTTLNAELLRQGLPLNGRSAFGSPFQSSSLPPPSLYSALSPTADTFHAYIGLLKRHGWAGDIPLALAWMRARQIVPHEKTLSFAVDALYAAACEGPVWHYVVTADAREDDALCQEENIMFERVADLDQVAYIRKRRTRRPDLELVDWLRTWCPSDIIPEEVRRYPLEPNRICRAG